MSAIRRQSMFLSVGVFSAFLLVGVFTVLRPQAACPFVSLDQCVLATCWCHLAYMMGWHE